MRQRFQILNDPRFKLVYKENRRFLEGPIPSIVRLNCEGYELAENIKKKTRVYPGMLLATYPTLDKGDLHSSVYGFIKEITPRTIFIDSSEREESDPIIEPRHFLEENLSGYELAVQMKQFGVNMRSLYQEVEVLIINGLNPDPGVTWAEPMLNVHAQNLYHGMELLKRLTRAQKIILAVPHGVSVSYTDVDIIHVNATYPDSVNDLLIKNITHQEHPDNVGIVSLHNVWSLGRVGYSGFPLIETVVTVGSATKWRNYIVRNGMTIGQLIDFTGIEIGDGDTILRGGPLRGECVEALERSITRGTHGVFVVEKGSVPLMEGHSPCVNCGACIQICPARINPNAISRYSEFANYNACLDESSPSCIDCGLCGYVCIARRPVLQYIRLANAKIKEMEEFVYTEITPESDESAKAD